MRFAVIVPLALLSTAVMAQPMPPGALASAASTSKYSSTVDGLTIDVQKRQTAVIVDLAAQVGTLRGEMLKLSAPAYATKGSDKSLGELMTAQTDLLRTMSVRLDNIEKRLSAIEKKPGK
jgi:hypothetical protein